jgi:N-acetylmuramoyl-L-alanine amidase
MERGLPLFPSPVAISFPKQASFSHHGQAGQRMRLFKGTGLFMVMNIQKTAQKKSCLSARRRRMRFLLIKCALFACGLITLAVITLSGRYPVRKESTSFTKSQEEIFQEIPSGYYAVAHCMGGSDQKKVSHPSFALATSMTARPTRTPENKVPFFDVRSSMESCIVEYTGLARSLSQSSTLMSDYDYEVLCQIVEAEAGTEDLVGRVLVANVIMNRIKDDEFPDTVSDVVFEYVHGVPQFSPVEDGSIYEVSISQETREAVHQVLQGVDYSKGALFFIQKDAAEDQNIHWFEQNLKFLLRHGVHEFYTNL